MARAIWSGSVSFGLVNVPVKAFTAVRDHSVHSVHFNQLEKGTGARIHYKRVSDKTGKEVGSDKIASGYELSSGKGGGRKLASEVAKVADGLAEEAAAWPWSSPWAPAVAAAPSQ